MSYRIPDALIAEENAKARRRAGRGLRRARPALGARRRRHRGDHGQGRRLRGRRPDLGRRHGRHALRALSWARRAARHLRQARGLRDDPSTHARYADLLAAFPLGQGRRLSRTWPNAPRRLASASTPSTPTRFQDQPGQALSYKFGSLSHSQKAVRDAGRRAQCRMHRDRREARLEGADGLDRRRLEFRRPVEPQPRASTGIWNR